MSFFIKSLYSIFEKSSVSFWFPYFGKVDIHSEGFWSFVNHGLVAYVVLASVCLSLFLITITASLLLVCEVRSLKLNHFSHLFFGGFSLIYLFVVLVSYGLLRGAFQEEYYLWKGYIYFLSNFGFLMIMAYSYFSLRALVQKNRIRFLPAKYLNLLFTLLLVVIVFMSAFNINQLKVEVPSYQKNISYALMELELFFEKNLPLCFGQMSSGLQLMGFHLFLSRHQCYAIQRDNEVGIMWYKSGEVKVLDTNGEIMYELSKKMAYHDFDNSDNSWPLLQPIKMY